MRLFRSCPVILLAFCLPVLAQQQRRPRIRYGPGVCGPADPSYIRTAEESGGQPLFLAPDEVAKSFALVSELTRSNHVTLLWARGELSEGHDFVVPADSTMKRLAFSLSFGTAGGKLAVIGPEGKTVTSETAGAAITPLNCGEIIAVAPPAPGKWHVQVAGKGRFWLEANGVSDIFMVTAEFVHLAGRPGHEGYFRIPGQPVAGQPAMLRVELSGKTRNVQFHLVSPEARTIQPVAMQAHSDGRDESEFFGELTLPATPFRLAVTGEDENGQPFERVFSSLFHSETVEVAPLDEGLDELPAGKTVRIRFNVRNACAARDFRIQVVDTRNFLSSREPRTLSLASGETRELPVDLNIPPRTPAYTRDTVIVTATSTSGPGTTNSAIVEFNVSNSTTPQP
ncbi:MAG TPA: PPC domain-containing protein [Terriglobia bacterium]|nr:PPC domain-containing protein [Terriglobia bacterium]